MSTLDKIMSGAVRSLTLDQRREVTEEVMRLRGALTELRDEMRVWDVVASQRSDMESLEHRHRLYTIIEQGLGT